MYQAQGPGNPMVTVKDPYQVNRTGEKPALELPEVYPALENDFSMQDFKSNKKH